METTAPAPVAPAPPPIVRSRTSRWPLVALVFGAAVAAVWIGTAIRAAGRGFDITDEGFYLLSYRWWDVDHRNFTGAAYLYGPVFALLGHDIAGLRLVRLGSVVAVHAVFGWSFLRWLRTRRPDAPPTRLWEVAGTVAIVAAGGAVYGWLPATPGYNDPVLLGALLAMAAVFTMARRPSAWLEVALGVLVVPILLAKWAALPVVLLVLAAAVVALPPRRLLPAGIRAAAGVAAAVAVLHFAVVPLGTAIPPLIEVNRLLAEGSMSMPVLLDRYATTTWPTVVTVAGQYGLLLIAAAVPYPRWKAGLGVAGLGVGGWYAITQGGLGGGAVNTLRFIAPLLAVLLFALVTVVAARICGRYPAEGARGWLLLAALVLLPLVSAIGTGNIPLKVAANAFAAWVAVLVAVLTGLKSGRWLTATVTAAALLATASIATGGLWRHPYRGVPGPAATATATGVPALASVRLDPVTAGRYAGLRARLRPYVGTDGRAVIGFDKMAGVVLLLGGRSVGELWYASNDRDRTATGIAAECTKDHPWWGDRAPVVIFNRAVTPADRTLLGRCGFDLGTTYRLLGGTGDLAVWVPQA